MSIEKMSKQQEAELVDSVMQAIKLANAGTHPNDAIVKVASDKKFNRHYVNRMVEAFNTSKSIKHRKEASGEAKAAAFDIADPEVIFKTLYPENVPAPAETKAADWQPSGTDVEETRVFNLESAPVVAKRADVRSHGKADLDMVVGRAFDDMHRQAQVVTGWQQKMADAREHLTSKICELAEYFRSNTHEPFANVESAVLSFDKSAKSLMDVVWDMAKRDKLGNDKRASVAAKVKYADRTPYVLVNDIFNLRREYAEATVKCASAATELLEFRKGLNDRLTMLTKSGNVLAPMMLGMMLPKGTTEGMKAIDSKPSLEDITSVDFEAERKGIQAQMLLHDMMKHDEVLNKVAPQKILSAFNDISTVAPRAIESPMIMRGLLRKAVESESSDPYEVANLVNIETGLKKRDAPFTKQDEA